MRKAIYGGTFDPIHYGHLRAAEEAKEALSLDRVVFVPAFIPPHKADERISPPGARLEMTRLAAAGNPSFEVSDIEIQREGRSYTVDTVRAFLKEDPVDLSLIVGSDSFNDIRTWCEYEELLRLVSFIVVPRPGYPPKKLGEALPVELARKFWYDSSKGGYVNPEGRSVVYLDTTLFGISASDIRRRVKEGLSIRYLVPKAVEDYIRRACLYR